MHESADKHPLDDDDADVAFGRADPTSFTPVYGPLQKLGIYLLLGGGVLVVMTGIMSSTAPMGSPLASITSTLNRLFSILLLVGFVALLVSYQIPRIKAWLETNRARYQTQLNAENPRAVVADRIFGWLWISCGLAIFVSWLSIILQAVLGPWSFLLHIAIIFLGFGLSITIAIWSTGVLRAFGVGVAAAIFLCPFLAGALALAGQVMGPNRVLLVILPPLLDSLILLSGLICATYVRVWTAYQAQS